MLGIPRFLARKDLDSDGDGAGNGSRTIQIGTVRGSSRRLPLAGQRGNSPGRTASISYEASPIPRSNTVLSRRRHKAGADNSRKCSSQGRPASRDERCYSLTGHPRFLVNIASNVRDNGSCAGESEVMSIHFNRVIDNVY